MFKYFGSKHLLASAYPPPAYDTIVEPFAGAAGYAVHHRRAVSRVILVEKDERVVALWRRLLGLSSEQILGIPIPKAGERSSEILVALAAGRTTRDTPESFVVSPRMEQRLEPMLRRIASVVDECRHFEVVAGDYRDSPEVEATWFVDPPYQPPAEGGRWDRTRGGRYLHSNQGIHFPELGRWCHSRAGQLIVCEQAGADWMNWTDSRRTRDGSHSSYSEVWFHRP